MSLPTTFFAVQGGPPIPGEAQFFTTSWNVDQTYSFVVPPGVTAIHGVCIGGGTGGGGYASGCAGGGALGWKNNVTVIPGETLTVTVGRGGGHGGYHGTGGAGGNSTIVSAINGNLIGAEGGRAQSGTNNPATPLYGSSGGDGGHLQDQSSVSWFVGGGGAGGYSGRGGAAGGNGFGGGGGGGSPASGATSGRSGAGGGVGIFGEGPSGQNHGGSSAYWIGGGGGSGGNSGGNAQGGAYGGGGASNWHSNTGLGGGGAPGAVRILWGVHVHTGFPTQAGVDAVNSQQIYVNNVLQP